MTPLPPEQAVESAAWSHRQHRVQGQYQLPLDSLPMRREWLPNPKRFHVRAKCCLTKRALKRRLEGVTQKALTQSLRRLERNGLVSRRVIPVSPIAVEYDITPLGRTLPQPLRALHDWTMVKLP